jgi:hypothetical protein
MKHKIMSLIILPLAMLFVLASFPLLADEIPLAARLFSDSFSNFTGNSSLVGYIVVENKSGGAVYFINESDERTDLGHVVAPAKKWNDKPFEAANWAKEGVCAVAVNAIHIKKLASPDDSTSATSLISILPSEMITVDPVKHASYFSDSSSIYTDIPAGEKIFGGVYSPFLCAKTSFSREGVPDEIKIELRIPNPKPLWINFENRFGGMITVKYPGSEAVPAGLVYRPVYGVGNFTGTAYCGIGRIRAVHSGVIDVSTSPYGEIGGFQIVPHFHADTSTVRNMRLLTQWMVIGPLDPNQKDYGLLADLFILTQPRFLDIAEDETDKGVSPVKSRFHAVVKYRGESEWKNIPSLVGRIDDALENVAEIRIYFPQEWNISVDSDKPAEK